jgi:hypothetical protein
VTKQGPNVRKLIIHKMSLIMVPDGGGIYSAIEAMATPGRIGEVAREATQWAEAVLALVRTAPDNPYGDDEAIAGEILRRIEEKKKSS